jgi:DNA-binding transcriptional ArsR family regulator
VQRVHFNVNDLSRISVMPGLGSTAEAVFGLELIGRGGVGLFEPWRRRVLDRLGAWSGPVCQLAAQVRPVPDLLWMIEPSQPRHWADRAARVRIARILKEFHRVAIQPYWSRIAAVLEGERNGLGRIVTAGGVERMLSTLHPDIRWRAPVLEVPGNGSGDIYLGGRGLVLAPSLFLSSGATVVDDVRRDGGRQVLVFPAAVDPAAGPAMWSLDGTADPAPRDSDGALGALVGRTRAAVLQALADACTTTELAQRLGISPAGASQHTSVLREAGLVASRRSRNMVLHSVTPLGLAIIEGRTLNSALNDTESALTGA